MTRWSAFGFCLLIAALAVLGVSALDPEWRAAVALSMTEGNLADPLKRPEFWGVEYGFIGAHLAAGRGFSGPYPDVAEPTAVMPPLLPMVFGAVFALAGYQTIAGFLLLLLIRVIVLGIGFWCLDRCAVELGGGGTRQRFALAGIAAILILVFAPRQLLFLVYDEWFLFGTVAFCLLSALRLLRGPRVPTRRSALVWGAALGAMALTQPVVAFALGCAMVAAALRDRRPRLLAALGVAAILLVPWAVRNTVRFGSPFTIKSTLFFELYYGTLVSPQGIHREEEVMSGGRHPFSPGPEHEHAVALGETAYFAEKRDLFLKTLRQSPGLYLAKVAYRAAYVTVLFPFSRVHQDYFSPVVPAAVKYELYPMPFLAAIVCWRLRPQRRRESVFLILCYGAFLLPYVLIHFWLRYWVQILPVHILLIFTALLQIASRVSSKRA